MNIDPVPVESITSHRANQIMSKDFSKIKIVVIIIMSKEYLFSAKEDVLSSYFC